MADTNVLLSAITQSLRAWPAIKLAEEHGFGGGNVKEKIEWLGNAILQIFVDNDVVYNDELEDYIAEVLYNEFDTVVEDGSLGKFTETMCRYYGWWNTGNSEKIMDELNILRSLRLPNAQCISSEPNDDDDAEDPSTRNAVVIGQNIMQVEETSRTEVADTNNTNSMDIDADSNVNNDDASMEDDGWQVVQRSKSKKR